MLSDLGNFVVDLKHYKWSTFLQKEIRVLMRKRMKMSNYLTQVFCGRLCVLCE